MTLYKTIAESNNFIALDKYTKYSEVNEAPAVYQTEAALEREFIQDLINQAYENPTKLTTPEAMLANVRITTKKIKKMKYILIIIAALASSLTFGQSNNSEQDTLNSNPKYDKVLADSLGADEYGMKSYFFVILKTGTNKIEDKNLVNEIFRGHMNNIVRLVEEGKLIVAGPFDKNDKNYRGLFILNNIKTIEEAKELLQTDPAIKNGLLDYDIFIWYGSAALPEYLPFSDKIWKSKP